MKETIPQSPNQKKKEQLDKSLDTLTGIKNEVSDIKKSVQDLGAKIDEILDDSGANIPEKEARTKKIFEEFSKLITERIKQKLGAQDVVGKMKGKEIIIEQETID